MSFDDFDGHGKDVPQDNRTQSLLHRSKFVQGDSITIRDLIRIQCLLFEETEISEFCRALKIAAITERLDPCWPPA